MVASRVRDVESFEGIVLWYVSRMDDVAFWRVGNFRRVGTASAEKAKVWVGCFLRRSPIIKKRSRGTSDR